MLNIRFGVMAPPLSRQLRKYNLDKEKVKQFQKDHDAINRLYIRGVIPLTTRERAHGVLNRNIRKEILGV